MKNVKMKKYLTLLSVLVFILIFATYFIGCTMGTTTATTEKVEKTGPIKIGLSMPMKGAFAHAMMQLVFTNTVNEVDKDAEIVVTNANFDAQKQISDVQDLISQKCDVIVIMSIDIKAVMPAVDAVINAGIPCVGFHRGIEDTTNLAFYTRNNELEAGRLAATYFKAAAEELVGTDKVKILNLVGALEDINAVDRSDGFKEVVNTWPENLEIVAEVPTEWNVDKARDGKKNR